MAKFPQYRDYLAARKDANNAMMALLAGSRLAVNTLSLTEGSDQLLPAIFPQVEHIERFNLKTESARQFLEAADRHLAIVAVPYALAVHEDFVSSCLDWIEEVQGRSFKSSDRKAVRMNETLFTAIGVTAPTVELELNHVVREMRNAQIHSGGRANSRLTDRIARMTKPARARRIDPEFEEGICDYFAACILMPKRLVIAAWTQGQIERNTAAMARAFAVSRPAMSYRLTQLGLLAPRQRCGRMPQRPAHTRPLNYVEHFDDQLSGSSQ